MTVNLAKGAIAKSRKKVIVKRLNAIQNFGAMDVLCTDKTGTLTQDRIILKRHLNILGEESERVLQYAFLNSHFQSGLRNLLDNAVLAHADLHKVLGIGDGYSKVDEIPFDFSRRRLSVVVAREDGDPHLQGRGRGDLRGLHQIRHRRRDRATRPEPFRGRKEGDNRSQFGRVPCRGSCLQGDESVEDDLYHRGRG